MPCAPVSEAPPLAGAGLVALHGWTLPLPEEWELAGTTGSERQGWLVLAHLRQPLARVGWRRHAAAADLARSLDRLGGEMRRRGGAMSLAVRRAVDAHQLWGEWDGPGGTWHGAVRSFPGTQLTLAATALRPGIPVAGLVAGATAAAAAGGWRWCAYGLDVALPARWRLVGMQAYAGLTRALWLHPAHGRGGTDQVLVLRRHACARRLLAGRHPGAWLVAGLERREEVVAQEEAQGVVQVSTRRPAASWWRRWRGAYERRQLCAWIETEEDRLVIQEWRGDGEALPCLRRTSFPVPA